jgi:putative hydroxymethylpyrimidine transport system permease protein
MLIRSATAPLLRGLTIAGGLLLLWQALVWVSGVPAYILPSPVSVAAALVARGGLIGGHLVITATEILLGLAGGTLLGVCAALVVGYFRPARRWLMPVLVASQAIPVFALAPLLVLWLGYGMASKVAMAMLIIFFPVTAAFLDGLRRTEPGWVDLARTMTAGLGRAGPQGDRLRILFHIRTPAALPALASGLRVATAVAPIGAVVGEWVGSSAGLGYLMLHANGRMQIDLMFAALLALTAFSLLLWFTVDALLRRLLPWQPDVLSESNQE